MSERFSFRSAVLSTHTAGCSNRCAISAPTACLIGSPGAPVRHTRHVVLLGVSLSSLVCTTHRKEFSRDFAVLAGLVIISSVYRLFRIAGCHYGFFRSQPSSVQAVQGHLRNTTVSVQYILGGYRRHRSQDAPLRVIGKQKQQGPSCGFRAEGVWIGDL